MKLYGIVDRKAKHVVSVFASVSDEAAERSFLMLLTGPQNIYTDFSEDFDLYPVAELNIDSGSLVVSAHGVDEVNKHGFIVDTFKVAEPLKSGCDYDKRYLQMIHADRFAPASVDEVSFDGNKAKE